MILIYSRIRKILLQLVMRLPRPAFAEVMGRLRRFLHRSSAEPAALSGRER